MIHPRPTGRGDLAVRNLIKIFFWNGYCRQPLGTQQCTTQQYHHKSHMIDLPPKNNMTEAMVPVQNYLVNCLLKLHQMSQNDVISVEADYIGFWLCYWFSVTNTYSYYYAWQLYRQVLLRARISYGNSVRLSVRLSRPGTEPSPGEIETPGLHRMIA